MDKTRNIKIESVKFIDFYEALSNNNPEGIGLSDEDFAELVSKWRSLLKNERGDNPTIDQIKDLELEKGNLGSALLVLSNKDSQEMINLCASYGIIIDSKNLEDGFKKIIARIKSITKSVDMLKTTLPPPPKNTKEITAYDVLANLSLNLEFGINFREITVFEYVAYAKALKKKSDSLKKIKNGRRAN